MVDDDDGAPYSTYMTGEIFLQCLQKRGAKL